MRTILLVVVTSGLVLLQITRGLTARLETDADFVEEAEADGFIVGTKRPTITEKPQDNFNVIITHDSLNPEANQSRFHNDILPTVTKAKTPEANVQLTSESTDKLLIDENAAGLITDGAAEFSKFFLETDEGSGFLPKEIYSITEMPSSVSHRTIGAAIKVDLSSEGSGMLPETSEEKQDDDLPFATTVVNSENPDISIRSVHSSEENLGSEIGTVAPKSDSLTTSSTIIVEPKIVGRKSIVNMGKPMDGSISDDVQTEPTQPKIHSRAIMQEPTVAALTEEGTPGWLLILTLCLVLGAVICIFVGIATKDMWYGPNRSCFNNNSTESKEHDQNGKAATLSLSEKEKAALMSTHKKERKETDYTIVGVEEAAEKEYLM